MAWRYFLRFLAEGDEEAARINHRLRTELAPPLLRFRYALKFWGIIRWRPLSDRRRALSSVGHPSGVGLIRV